MKKNILKKKKAMHVSVSERIEAELGQFEHGILPSLSDLSERYQASVVTVRKALNSLAQRGKITCVRGKRSRVVGAGDEIGSPAVRRLVNSIIDDIREGRLRAGDQMPKLDAVVLEHHVSRTTAHKAFVELERRRECHRVGSRRIVGEKSRVSSTRLTFGQNRVVIILSRTHSSYTHLFRSERTIDFMAGFHNELEKTGTRLMLGTWSGCKPGMIETELGRISLSELIGRMGDKYAGVALLSSDSVWSRRKELVEMALPFRRPVVELLTDDPNISHLGQTKTRSNYLRCIFDEWAAVGLALETLARSGHHSVCFPNLYRDYRPWVDERLRKARSLSKKLRLGIEIVPCGDDSVLDTSDQSDGRIGALVERWERRDAQVARLMREAHRTHGHLLRRNGLAAFGVMSVIAGQRDFSAILAPNDHIADAVYRWVQYKGLRVPQELSILSFDNNYKYRHVPVSTVDFGMNYTGYAAAQIFLKQVKVPVSSDGIVVARCHLVHRGTLGTPFVRKTKG